MTEIETGQGSIVTEYKADENNAVTGYGAVFGNIDQGGDVIYPGAFADSLSDGRPIKMLWQHDATQPIGVWKSAQEDENGLRVSGEILTAVAAGRDAAALVKAGAIDGLSIGYRTLQSRPAEQAGRSVRIIEKAELWEVSLVTFPMNRAATLDARKAAEMSKRDFERVIQRDAGLSRKVAAALMAGGWKAVEALRDSATDQQEEELATAFLAHRMAMAKIRG